MIDPVGSGNTNPMEMYKNECKRGADLFKESLDQYAKTKDPDQKIEYEKVIDKALVVMNETCTALRKKEIMEQEKKLETDFKEYKSDLTPERVKELHQEADQIKTDINRS